MHLNMKNPIPRRGMQTYDALFALDHFNRLAPPASYPIDTQDATDNNAAGRNVTSDMTDSIKAYEPQCHLPRALLITATSLQEEDIFSDLTITCKGMELKVHKLILYIQSKYFRKLLRGDFMVCRRSSNLHPVKH